MSSKFGSGFLVSAAESPELFQAFYLASKFQSEDEKKPAYTYSTLEFDGGKYVIKSTDSFKSIEIRVGLPMEMAGYFGERAVIKIQSIGAFFFFIPYQDFSDEINFPNCGGDFPDIEYMESIKLEIASKKEGETYANTAGSAFSQAAYAIQEFIGRPVAFRHIETFQKMSVEVYRDALEQFRGRFMVKGENETYSFTAVMTTLERVPLEIITAEKYREAMENDGRVDNGRVVYLPRLTETRKRRPRLSFN